MKKKSLNKIKQMVSVGMSCIMAGSTWSTWNFPTVLHAEEVHTESVQGEAKQEDAVQVGAGQTTYRITSFAELGEEIAYQTLPIGAEESEINFPDTLKVSVIRQVEEEPEESTTEAEEEKTTTEAEEEKETTSEVLESQVEEESQTEVETEEENESESQIEAELQTEVESQTKVETLESESEMEAPVTKTEVPETAALPEPQTQEPETTVSESETESTEQLESDTTEEESSIVASLIDNIKGLFAPVEVYAAEEPLAYSADGGNSAKDSIEGEEWIIEHITWKLDVEKSTLSEFDSSEESAGAVYFYTPTIPETDENGNHYILSEEAILPEICVMVDGVDNGIALYSSIVDSGTCGAEGNNGDNLTWTLDSEGVLTISGMGAMKDWNWNGSPWYKNKDIKSVMIEDGVTSIGYYAFKGCSSLNSITLPNSVTRIGDSAFYECSSLSSIILPNSVISIGYSAFYKCSSLSSITLPNSVTRIGDSAFYKCSSLSSITLPNSVTRMGGYAFYKCSSLNSITLPNSVTSIGYMIFYGCSSLKNITLSNSVTSIGKEAFNNCKLTNAIYLGTAEQWNNINISRDGNDTLLNNIKFHEHLPKSAWSNNVAYHWHQCTDETCPVKDEPQAQDSCTLHNWKNGKCTECNYKCKHIKLNFIPELKAKCVTDGNKAYYACEICDVIYWDEMGTNEITNRDDIKIAALGHKDVDKNHICDVCNQTTEHTGGTATCIAKAVCTTCGQPYGEVNSSNHAGKEEWIQTEEKHEKKWNCCNLVIVAEEVHEWKDGVCEECGYVCQHKDDNSDHLCDICDKKVSDHIGGTATCIAKAVCEKCGVEYGEIDTKNHDLLHHEAKAPTCTEIGWEAYDTCKREGCNYTTYKELPALKHDLQHHEAKAATCMEIGWEEYDTCKREGCGYTTYKEQPALKHDLEHHEAKAATCTEIGWEAYDTCKREDCDYTTYKELPALGHKDSNNDHLCDACSTKISDHSYESKITREATTTDTGTRTYTCTRCGHSYTEELAKLPSQTSQVNQSNNQNNQTDQTNSVEPANNGNEKDFIGTVTSVFFNVTSLAAKNFIVSIWLLIQMLLKAVM